MIFSSKARSHGRRSAAGARVATTAALCLALLAACGGGTSTVDPFRAQRVLVFGDETSTLTLTGRKYGVNGLNANNGLDCAAEPLWVQSVANLYGFVFAECNPNFADPKAIMRAQPGAKVADVTAQVEAQVAAGGFRDRDLATVQAGMNDILDLYSRFPGSSVASLKAEAGARGAQLASVVNRLVGLGVKVVVADLHDLGLSPYALAQKALDPSGQDRAALISSLVTAFNEQLGVKVVLDGRFVGLVQAQLRFQAIGRSPASFGIANATDAACLAPVPNCTTLTLVPGATSGSYVWADNTRLSTGGQAQLGALAVDRAQRNPF